MASVESIAPTLARLSFWAIAVKESRAGEGTQFTIDMPIRQE